MYICIYIYIYLYDNPADAQGRGCNVRLLSHTVFPSHNVNINLQLLSRTMFPIQCFPRIFWSPHSVSHTVFPANCVKGTQYVRETMDVVLFSLDSVSHTVFPSHMGWLWLVGSIKLWVSFAKEPYKTDNILQKRPIILSILLTVFIASCVPFTHFVLQNNLHAL